MLLAKLILKSLAVTVLVTDKWQLTSLRVDMPALYKYVPINGRYYCLKQNAVALAWFLHFNNKSFQLHSHLTSGWGMNTVKTLIKYQLRLRSNASVLELPIYGNLCLPVHRGYKVFSFRRKTVTKIMENETHIHTDCGRSLLPVSPERLG